MLRPHSPSPRTGRGHRPCLRRPAAANGAAANLGVQKAVRVPGHVPVSEAAGSQPSDCVRSTRAKAKMLQRHGGGGGAQGRGPGRQVRSLPPHRTGAALVLCRPLPLCSHTRGPTHTHTHTRELSRVQSHTRTDAHTPTHSYRQLPGHQTTCQQRQENARDGHLFSGPERLGRVGWRPTPHCLEAPGTEVSAMSGFRSSLAFGLLCNRCVHDLGCDRATCGASDGSSPRGDSR